VKLFNTDFMSKKFLTIIFSVSYILGLTAFFTETVIFCSLILFLILIIFLKFKLISEKSLLVFMTIFLVGILNANLRNKESDLLSSFAPAQDITVEGTVISLPTSSSNEFIKFSFETESFTPYGKITEKNKSKVLVNLFAPKEKSEKIEIGNKLKLKGRLTKPKRASNPSEFCYAEYLKNQHIFSRLYVQENDFKIISHTEKPVLKFLFKLNRLRKNIINMHSKNIKSPSLELLGGIVFGDDAVNPTPEMKISFVNSGLMHIIAASGMNVSLIFGMWFFLSQILRINYKFSIFIGMLSVVCYTCMTGFGPPVLRAALMLLLILFGKMINRKADSISLLFIVAFLLLLISPSMLTNIGFQLSFSVTLGLLLFCPILLDKIKNKIFYTISSFIIIPLIAQFFAAPIQMFYFNTFTPYSIFANIAVVPTLSFVSFGGFLSSIFAMIPQIGVKAVNIFDFLLSPFLKFINIIADYFSNLPHSNIIVPSPSILQVFLYYLIVIVIYALIKVSEKLKKHIAAVLLGTTLLFFGTFIHLKSNHSEILFFDVGNADAALIKTPSEKLIMIDTGKAPYKEFSPAAERIIYSYFKDSGIKKLDGIIVTHFDSDHSGGTPFLIQNLKIDKLFVRKIPDFKNIQKEPFSETTVKIFQSAKDKNVPVSVPENGKITISDETFKITSYYIENSNDNDSSTVNIYNDIHGNNAVFCADTEVKSLMKLVNNFPSKTNILKVSHHGAKNTVSDKFLKKINPDYALISTGFNIYGHPDNGTIDTLSRNNIRILRTDRNNAVKFVLQKDKVLVYSYNTRRKKFEKIYD